VLAWPASLSGYHPIGLGCSLLGTVVVLWTMRAGLVGTLALIFCLTLWLNFPVTANADAPHFGIGLVAVLLIAALGTYGAIMSTRPSFAAVVRRDLAAGHRP